MNNKKKILFFTPLVAISLLSTSCGNKVKNYKVTFNSNGGSEVSEQIVEEGKKATRPNDPKKDGFDFITWCSDVALNTPFKFTTSITCDMTLYAKWVSNVSYTVTFNSNGGSEVSKQTIKENSKVNKPNNPSKDGHDFICWCIDKDLNNEYNFDTPVKSSFTLYAKWIEVFNVIFDSKGGSSVETQKVRKYGYATKPQNPTRDGYVFVNWYADEALVNIFDFSEPIIYTRVLYAKWEDGIYTVTFDLNGGTGEGEAYDPQRVKHGNHVSKPIPDPTKEGTNFRFWSISIDNPTKFDFYSETVYKDTTLYAIYEIKTFEINFIAEDCSPIEKQIIEYNGKVVKPTDPDRSRDVFAGWYTDEDYRNLYDFDSLVKSSFTLYAKWDYVPVTSINFVENEIIADRYDYKSIDYVIEPYNASNKNVSFTCSKEDCEIIMSISKVICYTSTFDSKGNNDPIIITVTSLDGEGTLYDTLSLTVNKGGKTTSDDYFNFLKEDIYSSPSFKIGAKDKDNLPSDIVLPSMHTEAGGHTCSVSIVSKDGFRDCSNLEYVRYEENTINKIEEDAFNGCSNLKYFVFDEPGVIYPGAFLNSGVEVICFIDKLYNLLVYNGESLVDTLNVSFLDFVEFASRLKDPNDIYSKYKFVGQHFSS